MDSSETSTFKRVALSLTLALMAGEMLEVPWPIRNGGSPPPTFENSRQLLVLCRNAL